MEQEWLQFWDDRYQKVEYAYGTQPNVYLKAQLSQITPAGKILFAAEGEGRNAVYAAQQGWQVSAFDISKEGRIKALALAKENKVSIDYQVGYLTKLNFANAPFDVIALIYAHFPPDIKSVYHKLLDQKLKKGGMIIFEAFGKKHLEYRNANLSVGGPPDIDSLFSTDELRSDFKNYEILELLETEVELTEGLYHNGKGAVTRFVGRKC
ncbi:MAG: class I SAM-dependent methyltransferase [Bacteroidota bacterium]